MAVLEAEKWENAELNQCAIKMEGCAGGKDGRHLPMTTACSEGVAEGKKVVRVELESKRSNYV